MADSFIGRTEPLIRSAGAVERTGTATDRDRRRHPQQDQREQEESGRRRRRLYDLLFDEIDEIDDIDPQQKARIKQNLRAHLAAQAPAPSHAATPAPEHDEEALASALIADHDAAVPVSTDHIVHLAAPTHPHVPPQEAVENAILARQLRDCLARHTLTARRVAVYLHLLLSLDGALRPHLVVDT